MKSLLFLFQVIFCIAVGYSQICDNESEQFTCWDGTCIPMERFCDGNYDCDDLSDEPDSCASCDDEMFMCSSGPCIPMAFVCDGKDDCGDESDEPKDRNPCPVCKEDQFRCSLSGKCILRFYVCDGYSDCEDGSDEHENPSNCPACKNLKEFRCSSGRCLEEAYICNGLNECGDWGDEGEELCPCLVNEVRCNSSVNHEERQEKHPGECIPAEWWCDSDGIVDCVDGSDEANCYR